MMKKIFVGLVAAMLISPAVADKNCEDIDTYEYIAHDIAMCSTHAYNINRTDNNMTAAERAQMKEVIALKSTIVTQQLYKQYESLDKLIKKLRTQLEKAVLTANLEASGATPAKSSGSDSASSFSSNDRNVFMAGVKNCNSEATVSAVFSCLQSNYTTIYNTSGNGTKITSDLRKQLANDYTLAYDSMPVGATKKENEKCKKANNITGRDVFQTCLDNFITLIRNANSTLTSSKNQQQQMMNKMFDG